MPAHTRTRDHVWLAYGTLLITISGIAWSAIFIRWSTVPGLSSAFYRVFIASLVLVPWRVLASLTSSHERRRVTRMTWRAFFLGLASTNSGVATAHHFVIQSDVRGAMTRRPVLCAGLCSLLVGAACSKSNNLLLGRVEAQVGGHTVVVTDCYRTSVPKPELVSGSAGSAGTYRFVPCRDADVTISAEKLTVNGQTYGTLAAGDTVAVDHGKVLINDREARVVAASR